MPVRRKANKRRSTEGLQSWLFVFSGGYDYFDELAAVGVETDKYGRPSRADTEAAWRRLGDAFLELPRHPDQGTPWALEQFGPPSRRAGRSARRYRVS